MTDTYHHRLSPHELPTGWDRTRRLEEMRDAERQALKGFAAGSYNHRMAEMNVQELDEHLERAKANDAALAKRKQELQVEADEKRAAREAEEETRLKDQLRMQFRAGNPNATDEDFERLYPELKDRHLIRQAEEALSRARARYRI